MFTKHPWIKVYTIWKFLPLKLQNWQKWSLGIQTWNFTKYYPCTIHKLQFGTFFDNFWEITISPLNFGKFHKWSSGVLNCNKIKKGPLVYLTWQV